MDKLKRVLINKLQNKILIFLIFFILLLNVLPGREELPSKIEKSSPFVYDIHLLKYIPNLKGISGQDEETRHRFYYEECSKMNITKDEMNKCTYDFKMFFRRRRLKEICMKHKHRYKPSTIHPKRLFVMSDRNLLWCPVYKAASTNWMKNIPLLANPPIAQYQYATYAEHWACSLQCPSTSTHTGH